MSPGNGVEVILETFDAEESTETNNEARIHGPRDVRLPTGKRARVCLQFDPHFDLKGAAGVKITIAIGEEKTPSMRSKNIQSIWRRQDVLFGQHVVQATALWDHKLRRRPISEQYMRIPAPTGTIENLTSSDDNSADPKDGSIVITITRGDLHSKDVPKRKLRKTDPPSRARKLPMEQIDHIRPEWFEPLPGDHGEPYIVEFRNLGTFTDEILANPAKYGRGKRKRLPTPGPAGYVSDLRALFSELEEEASLDYVRSDRLRAARRLMRSPFGPGDDDEDEDDEEIKPIFGNWQVKQEEQVGASHEDGGNDPAIMEQQHVIELSDGEDEGPASVKKEPPAQTRFPTEEDVEDDKELIQLRLQENLLRQEIRKRELQKTVKRRRGS